MRSKRGHEGYLVIDSRAADPLPEAFVKQARALKCVMSTGREQMERPIITCSHCQATVVMNPERTRDREWCSRCDHYICDGCGLARRLNGGACRPFKMVLDVVDRYQEPSRIRRALTVLRETLRLPF